MSALADCGWMHGDIKPSNIFFSPQGHVTLLDLGLARRLTGDATRPAAIQGTPWYLAPEYFGNLHAADIRSDIYSLGAVVFHLLTGRPPVTGETWGQIAIAHKHSAIPKLRSLVPQLSSGAIGLIRQMLANDPLRRPQTPRDLVAELVRLEIDSFSERAA
jgi:eukaryotic-like serine/threonine-protein kinase